MIYYIWYYILIIYYILLYLRGINLYVDIFLCLYYNIIEIFLFSCNNKYVVYKYIICVINCLLKRRFKN